MLRQLTLIVFTSAAVFAAAALFAQVPAQGTVVKSKSNITNNIVAEADGRLKCVTPAGKACTAQEAQETARVINTSRSNIKGKVAVAPDGTLSCQTDDGKPCTAAQASELSAAIRPTYDVKASKK